jgi:hypothetical protein
MKQAAIASRVIEVCAGIMRLEGEKHGGILK